MGGKKTKKKKRKKETKGSLKSGSKDLSVLVHVPTTEIGMSAPRHPVRRQDFSLLIRMRVRIIDDDDDDEDEQGLPKRIIVELED